MLVLSRKNQEAVMVGGTDGFEHLLKVTVLGINNGSVRLGFEVDAAVPVHRWEVWQRILSSGRLDPAWRRRFCARRLFSFNEPRCPMQLHYIPNAQLTCATTPGVTSATQVDEVLVRDSRAGLSPADMVERKLLNVGHCATMSASQGWPTGRRARP